MKPKRKTIGRRNFVIALVTAPDFKTARRLATAALQARLVACANLVPKIESHYWWKNKIEAATEVLILFKTEQSCLTELEKVIVAAHSYDTPEFIVLPISGGNRRYLNWVRDSVLLEPTRLR